MINTYNVVAKPFTLDPSVMVPLILSNTGRDVYYKQGYFGQDVVVAVLDTGISSHFEFENRILPGQNTNSAYTNRNDVTDDCHPVYHGTHVSGTIAGLKVGVAPKAKILPVKVLGPNGASTIDLINGLKFVRDWKGPNGETVDIVNMSLGGPMDPNVQIFTEYHNLIKELVNKGIIVIVASGNSGDSTIQYPSYFHEVVTVGAVDISKRQAMFTTTTDEVDLSQIGVDVISCAPNGRYQSMSGTSMATPVVSGIAALIISKYKFLFKTKMPEPALYEMLKLLTSDIGILGVDPATGAGFCSIGT